MNERERVHRKGDARKGNMRIGRFKRDEPVVFSRGERKRQNTETVTFLHQPTGEKVTFTGWAAIALFRRTEPWVELKQ